MIVRTHCLVLKERSSLSKLPILKIVVFKSTSVCYSSYLKKYRVDIRFHNGCNFPYVIVIMF